MIKCRGCGKDYEPRHAKDYRCKDCHSKIGRNSKRKGSSNELQFAKRLERVFNDQNAGTGEVYRVRRTPMSGAMHLDFPADIFVARGPQYSVLRNLHLDCKVAENWSPERYWQEEKELCRASGQSFQKVIITLRHPNSQDTYAFMKWDDLEKLLLEIEGYRHQEHHDQQ